MSSQLSSNKIADLASSSSAATNGPITSISTQTSRRNIAIAATVIQLALAGIYTWGLFVDPLYKLHHLYRLHDTNNPWDSINIMLAFNIALVTMGIGAVMGSYLRGRVEPRTILSLAGALYALGFIGAGLFQDLWGLYLTYSVMSGLGTGICYTVLLKVLLEWFPDKRQMILWLGVSALGGGMLLIALIAPMLIAATSFYIPDGPATQTGVYPTFAILGTIYLIMITGAAQFCFAPPNHSPHGSPPVTPINQYSSVDYALSRILDLRSWYALWAALFLSVIITVMVVGTAIASSYHGILIGLTLGIFILICNSLGHLFATGLPDQIRQNRLFLSFGVGLPNRIKRSSIFPMAFLLQFALAFVIASPTTAALYNSEVLDRMPAFVSSSLGLRYLRRIYGSALTAWMAGGLLAVILIQQGVWVILVGILMIMMVSAVDTLARQKGDQLLVTLTGHTDEVIRAYPTNI